MTRSEATAIYARLLVEKKGDTIDQSATTKYTDSLKYSQTGEVTSPAGNERFYVRRVQLLHGSPGTVHVAKGLVK